MPLPAPEVLLEGQVVTDVLSARCPSRIGASWSTPGDPLFEDRRSVSAAMAVGWPANAQLLPAGLPSGCP